MISDSKTMPTCKAHKIPPRIQRLPKDVRGFPIPWNVLRGLDNEPFFIVNDDRKHFQAVRQGLCPICGETLGKWKWFTGGPRSAFDENGWYIDLPAHRECSEFSLMTCPYLSAPRYLRETGIIPPSRVEKLPCPALVDETINPERPSIFVSVASRGIEVFPRGPFLPYVRPIKPLLAFTFWKHGVKLTLDEGIREVRQVLGPDWNPPTLET